MKRIKYVGPSDAVDVGVRTFPRGEVVEVEDELAGPNEDGTGLLAQDIWEEVGAKKPKSDPAPAGDHEETPL